jgi:hypothetical protein
MPFSRPLLLTPAQINSSAKYDNETTPHQAYTLLCCPRNAVVVRPAVPAPVGLAKTEHGAAYCSLVVANGECGHAKVGPIVTAFS